MESSRLNSASYKMNEQARECMADADMGGGRFDGDVLSVSEAAASYQLPQQYDAGERQALDESLAQFNKPVSLNKHKTGTKLYTAQLSGKAKQVFVRIQMEVRAPAEHVIAYYMAIAEQFTNHDHSFPITIGERRNDHNVVVQVVFVMPSPVQDRQLASHTRGRNWTTTPTRRRLASTAISPRLTTL